MAITLSTDRLDGLSGIRVDNIYARIECLYLKQYDDGFGGSGTDAGFRILYDVQLFKSADTRNADGEYPAWRNVIRSREIDHFKVPVTLDQLNANGANPFIIAYADLKTRLAAGDSPVATNIADAV